MTSMAFCNSNSDMDFLDSVSMECDLQTEVDKYLQGSDKFGFDYILNNENSNQSGFDFETNNTTVDEWIQSMQWNDVVKGIQNNLLDSSFEVENNNPNLLVNPQTGLPVNHFSPKKPHVVPQLSGSLHINNTAVKSELSSSQASTLGDNLQNQRLTVQTDHNLNQSVSRVSTTQSGQFHQIKTTPVHGIQTVKATILSPSKHSPVLVEHLQHGVSNLQQVPYSTNSNTKKSVTVSVSKSGIVKPENCEKVFPKPVYSYSCLIAMALKNSLNGSLPVSEIYNFMTEHFPYFKTAPDGWKNSVRHNLSLNKCFAKVETPKMTGNNSKKGCLWALNPEKIEKMEDEIAKHRKKDLDAIKSSMSKPEKLELIEAGKAGPVGSSKSIESNNTPLQSPVQTATPTTTTRVVTIAPIDVSKREDYLLNGINIMENNLTLDTPLPDLTLQNGIWDDLSTDMELPMSTGTQITLNASPLTIQSVVSLGSGLYQGNIAYTTSPVVTQNVTATQSSQTPSRILEARI